MAKAYFARSLAVLELGIPASKFPCDIARQKFESVVGNVRYFLTSFITARVVIVSGYHLAWESDMNGLRRRDMSISEHTCFVPVLLLPSSNLVVYVRSQLIELI